MNCIKGEGKRINVIMMLFSCLFFVFLTGCGKVELLEGTNLILEKKGGLKVGVYEDFPADHYDIDEFNQMNETEVSLYNQNAGEERVQIISSETDGQMITNVMHYASYKDFSDINRIPLFVGTGAEAVAAGYDIANTYTRLNEEQTKTDLSDSDLSEYQIVIVNDTVNIHSYKKIKYIYGNVTVSDNKKTATVTNNDLAVIVF